PEIDERQREKTTDGTIQLVGRSVELGEKQIGRFAGVTQVAQRARQLDSGAAAAQAAQARFERGAVKRNSKIRMARGILRRGALERGDGTTRRKLSNQHFNLLQENLRLV